MPQLISTTSQVQPDSLQARQAFLLPLIVQAGELALDYFRRVHTLAVDRKTSGQDVASAADRDVEQFLRERLSQAFPEDGYLGEEYGPQAGTSGYRWVIDPIDGTSCFLHGLPDWCISVGLAHDGGTDLASPTPLPLATNVTPGPAAEHDRQDDSHGATALPRAIAGAIYLPCTQELFHAQAGGPAWRNDSIIHVADNASLQQDLIGVGASLRLPPASVSGFLERLLSAGGMFYRNGSCASMLCHVACGRLAAYYEPHIYPWDCLAGLCIIEAAGGWYAPTPVTRLAAQGSPVLAGAPGVRQALEALADAGLSQ